jgi:hypothetical protein
MIWRDGALVTKEETNLRPLDPLLEPLSCQQLINSPRRVTPSQYNAKRIKRAAKLGGIFNNPFCRGDRKLLWCVEN